MSLRQWAISIVEDFVQHGSNEFALHFGHGGAISAGTGRVKRLFGRISYISSRAERRSLLCPSNVSARCASSRIVSKISLTELMDSAMV
jgi:hypothetical protein